MSGGRERKLRLARLQKCNGRGGALPGYQRLEWASGCAEFHWTDRKRSRLSSGNQRPLVRGVLLLSVYSITVCTSVLNCPLYCDLFRLCVVVCTHLYTLPYLLLCTGLHHCVLLCTAVTCVAVYCCVLLCTTVYCYVLLCTTLY